MAKNSFRAIIALTRPGQWPKNLLVLAVPLAAGELTELRTLTKSLLAVLALTLLSMATYCGNDARDVADDRQHPQKKHRPLASDQITTRTALLLALLLATVGLVLSAMISSALLFVGSCYLLVQVFYTCGMKHLPLGDITCIALGFVLRALAGGAATSLPISNLFVVVICATSFFIVSAKRSSEIERVDVDGETRRVLAFYSPEYLRLLWSSSMTISIVVYVIWSSEIQEQSALAKATVVPFVFALLRYASHVTAGRAEEPEKVVRKDRALLLLAVLWFVIFATRTVLL